MSVQLLTMPKPFTYKNCTRVNLNSVHRYRQMLQLQQHDYVLAPYLSAINVLVAAGLSADLDVVAMVFM